EGRVSATAVDQLTFEVAKLDLRLQQIDARRKQLEAESEMSEASKDRLAPVIKDLDASRAPIETQKQRLEQERTRLLDKRQLERALENYRKAVEKAAAEPEKANLAKALLAVARVCEISVPENIGDAQAAYARVVAECGGQEAAVAEAERKILLRGVDVYLDQFSRFVTTWRDFLRSSPASMEAKRKELEAKILAIGKDATHGLIEGFSHKDEVVRSFAAGLIASTADEAGIAALIRKLGEGSPATRAGAGLAISRIFETWSAARTLEREADQILADLDSKDPEDPGAQRLIAANRERANDLKQKAAAIRGNLPANLPDKPEIEAALHRLLSDESGQTVARIEAAKALRSLGQVSGTLIDAILNGLKSRNQTVREACCVAASGVDTTNSAAKHKLADRLMEIVQYEPDLDLRPADQRDTANDAGVRAAAASSLGAIGVVKACPALTEALSDSEPGVRRSAHEALKRITALDLGYDPDPLISGLAPEEVPKAQAAKRQEGIDRWAKWWQDTLGTGVLVARFWNFQAQVKGGDPSRLYDREGYLRELKNRSYAVSEPAAYMERAERTCERFHTGKDWIQRDATDLGAPAIDKFILLLSGATAGDKRLSLELQARSRAVTRLFVAETIAKLIADAKAADKPAVLREKVGAGGSKDERAGAALALGFLPKEMSGPEDREALEKRGLEDQDPEVREAASRALGRVGAAACGPALAKVASVNSSTRAGEAAQLAALRALVALGPKHEEVIRVCGELIGDEGSKRSTSFAVREAACDVLGAVADPAAIKGFWLFRGRRDIARPVRDAATRAIAAIAAADPSTPEAIAAVVSSPVARSIDRTGAALALGDLGVTSTIPTLVWQIVDRNPPMAMKATDPGVRAICAEALGNMGEKARYKIVAEKLIDALADPADLVKTSALEALRKIAPAPPEEDLFRVKDADSARATGIARLRAWLEANRDKWPELAQ
ncbi:MAG TPA: HEAT repeat domain-containing protein, partial [Planctomycetota bacterium]|nr:HEAT repeat domain-containing protein [Planctomycetota bacterium]